MDIFLSTMHHLQYIISSEFFCFYTLIEYVQLRKWEYTTFLSCQKLFAAGKTKRDDALVHKHDAIKFQCLERCTNF